MAETVQTADSSGQVTQQSPQEGPQPKAKSGRASGRRVSAPKTNSRGVPVTVWDNPALDPNKRKSVEEDPDGTENAKLLDK